VSYRDLNASVAAAREAAQSSSVPGLTAASWAAYAATHAADVPPDARWMPAIVADVSYEAFRATGTNNNEFRWQLVQILEATWTV